MRCILRQGPRLESLLVIAGNSSAVLLGIVTGAPILGFLRGAEQSWLLVANLLILRKSLTIAVLNM